MKIATREQVREIDRATIEDYGVPGLVLMENAGRAAADVLLEEYPFAESVAVFAGAGNNGGDGFVIARHLIGQGLSVTVYLAADPAKYRRDALTNFKALKNLGCPMVELKDSTRKYKPADVIVDALFGTGLDRNVDGFYKKLIEFINDQPAPKLAVDVPSGLDSNTGLPLGAAVKADITVTFIIPKVGISIYPGVDYAGRLYVADLTTPKALEENIPFEMLTHSNMRALVGKRPADTHKGTYGHLFILAGSPGKSGAAALASMGALRAGTGLVTVGIPESLNSIMEIKTTEAMTEPLPETAQGTFGMVSISRAMEIMAAKKTAVAIGPGITVTDDARDFLYEIIKASPVPLLVDADAITLVAKNPGILKKAKSPVVLTPHPGEMSRLAGISTADVQADRIGVSLKFAREHGVYVILKGARSLVSCPDGKAFVNTTGNPGMAAGGMGDVLTGITGGFLAQGMSAESACKLGVFAHAAAGDRAASERGEAGITASDLADALPAVIKNIPTTDDEPFIRIR